jgi:hypothetical protein
MSVQTNEQMLADSHTALERQIVETRLMPIEILVRNSEALTAVGRETIEIEGTGSNSGLRSLLHRNRRASRSPIGFETIRLQN